MNEFMDISIKIFIECWDILIESAPCVLFGFFAASILKNYLLEKLVAKHLGGNSMASVFKASLFGIPLPLCSCGVIPALSLCSLNTATVFQHVCVQL